MKKKGPKPKLLMDRLLGLTLFSPQTHCWIVSGWRLPNGYGHIGSGGKGKPTLLAHRAAWMAFNGPIPIGLNVLHKCDVRACVNPDHLFLGTHKDNYEDMVRKGRQGKYPDRKGDKNNQCRLTEEQVKEIKQSTEKTRFLAKRFGMGRTTIQQIRSGRSWKHL